MESLYKAQARVLAVNLSHVSRQLIQRTLSPQEFFLDVVEGDDAAKIKAIENPFEIILVESARCVDKDALIAFFRTGDDLSISAEIIVIGSSSFLMDCQPGECCYVPSDVSADVLRRIVDFKLLAYKTRRRGRASQSLSQVPPSVREGPHGLLYLTWPGCPEPQEKEDRPAASSYSAVASSYRQMRGYRILFAHEGDRREASAVTLMLRSNGFNVVVTRNGIDTLALAQHRGLNLILVDQSVDMNVLHELQLSSPTTGVPVVEFTWGRARMLCIEPTVYLSKPCATPDFLFQLDALIRFCNVDTGLGSVHPLDTPFAEIQPSMENSV